MKQRAMLFGITASCLILGAANAAALPPHASVTLDPHTKVLRQSDAIDAFRAWRKTQPEQPRQGTE